MEAAIWCPPERRLHEQKWRSRLLPFSTAWEPPAADWIFTPLFDEIHGDRNNSDIEVYAGDDYVYGEEDDEQDSAVCGPSVNESQCEMSAEFVHGTSPQSNKARECPGSKRVG